MREIIFWKSELERKVSRALSLIPGMEVEQLVKTAAHARELEGYAFLIRGACACELRRRVGARLAGGRGRRDEAGAGVQSRLERLAESVGVDLVTLRTDARIHETFFSDRPGEETALARERGLAREYYVTALAAPDPPAAIEMAVAARRERPYTRQQFRADVRALKKPAPAGRKGGSAIVKCPRRVALTREIQCVLSDICRETGRGPEEVVAEALLALRKQLLGGKSEKTAAALRRSGRGAPKAVGKRIEPVAGLLQYSFDYWEEV